MAQQYRKRPVVIEAMQYVAPTALQDDGVPVDGNTSEIVQWTGGAVGISIPDWFPRPVLVAGEETPVEPSYMLIVKTLEDGRDGGQKAKHMASPGDWIVRGVSMEFYPVKPDTFAQTYEPVEAPARDQLGSEVAV